LFLLNLLELLALPFDLLLLLLDLRLRLLLLVLRVLHRIADHVAGSATQQLTLFQKTDGLSWIDTNDKARSLLRRLGFHSGTHRRERFVDQDRPELAKETARGYEIKLEAVHDLLSRYCTRGAPSRASQSNGHNQSVRFNPHVTPVEGRRKC